jgi:hypothetical protein
MIFAIFEENKTSIYDFRYLEKRTTRIPSIINVQVVVFCYSQVA